MLTGHLLAFVALAQHVDVLGDQGRVLKQGPPAQLRRDHPQGLFNVGVVGRRRAELSSDPGWPLPRGVLRVTECLELLGRDPMRIGDAPSENRRQGRGDD